MRFAIIAVSVMVLSSFIFINWFHFDTQQSFFAGTFVGMLIGNYDPRNRK